MATKDYVNILIIIIFIAIGSQLFRQKWVKVIENYRQDNNRHKTGLSKIKLAHWLGLFMFWLAFLLLLIQFNIIHEVLFGLGVIVPTAVILVIAKISRYKDK
ncbi:MULTISPECIES: hypothetical protein [unclassified Enterococcus]|uniref:hypothetical protein n=1 Tax=unclassified Enterococcus TaxID=2608891 RepID=UPI00155544A0|nr:MULTISPECIES: hypothetical protein [unclassified Enterococcus]MBS7576478.1 hypothetical protein [Enterococcus sp. MMGLQ5-2]MBS7583710.1 hypothetical protein [Enterococcus sp. MMGLQ5-1]NPD11571.1 hypothetical protein [Enterococcus sp. MMGLQ5-1]NPD36315.1 hypothetical protein [Enterococcus sp. MMGLQ5-2]